ncbi:S8 family peptidase [Bacteriovorax sp. Seq25_V]|uniref:S8 family peptidase n=1 Tax=Bacteriovorax sp. Seq25_V TaxID=1201288 RepID=UPI00038A1ABD|nr:S8 family peptidase [Bacteriovorax sp. Seq25_V]EQC43710.1 thermitase family protein [Bacteriovorax sp. Seq25_V]
MKRIFVAAALVFATPVLAQNFNGYIVKLKNNAESFSLPKSMSAVETLSTSFGTYAVVQPAEGLEQESVEMLKNDSNIEYVEKNWIVTLDNEVTSEVMTSTDSMYSKQWGLKNTGTNSGGWFSSGKAGEDVNAERAWEIQKGNKDIVVAVIDTGIDYRHPDLQANLWVNEAEKNGEPGVDDDGNGFVDDVYGYDFANNDADPIDGHSHGTHCAGVIGAAHNGQGVMGVMSKVKLMGIKFLSDSGSGETIGAIKSIEYAIKNGANIMSNSWGGGERSEALKEAIVAAKDAGILFVAAAGNESNNNDSRPTYPASYDVENVITVGAMDGKGNKASFSNYGKESVHVFAPGVNILSTVKNGGYQKMSGTSMATPMVSGVLGLLLSQEEGINFSDAKTRLMESTVRNSSLSKFSIDGRVDAFRMLRGERN